MRTRSMRNAGVSKLMTRLYVLSMNFGQAAFGFTFCPIAKSNPEPEYSTLLTDPIAFDALSMTVFASCANAVDVNNVINAITVTSLLNIFASLGVIRVIGG